MSETPNRRVLVDGMYFTIPADTPDPLPDETERDLREQARRQREAWDRQDRDIGRALQALNAGARLDEDGGVLNAGMLQGDEPIEFGTADTERGDGSTEANPYRGEVERQVMGGGGDAVAPEIRALERPARDPGETEDVTDRQRGWRP